MCYRPVAIRVNVKELDRTREKNLLVPCRKCYECKQKRAREWALRCMFENKNHEASCFLTLTYRDNPVTLVKRDLQLFIKRLRKHIYPTKIRYFSCGEYGEKKQRPHFHILIFGYDFPNKYVDSESERGYLIYNDVDLERLWGHGLTTIQDVTLRSAAYCALYASKHKTKLPPHLQHAPEFNTMSQGLGTAEILKNIKTYMKTDEIWFDGVKHNIPDCVLKKKYNSIARLITKDYLQLKANRVRKAMENANSYFYKGLSDCDMYEQKKYLKENAIKRLTRKI